MQHIIDTLSAIVEAAGLVAILPALRARAARAVELAADGAILRAVIRPVLGGSAELATLRVDLASAMAAVDDSLVRVWYAADWLKFVAGDFSVLRTVELRNRVREAREELAIELYELDLNVASVWANADALLQRLPVDGQPAGTLAVLGEALAELRSGSTVEVVEPYTGDFRAWGVVAVRSPIEECPFKASVSVDLRTPEGNVETVIVRLMDLGRTARVVVAR